MTRLAAGTHANKAMQADFDAHGKDSFRFEVLEKVGKPHLVRQREQARMIEFDAHNNGYNTLPATTRVTTDQGRQQKGAFEWLPGESLAELIRRRREHLALSQKTVANAIGVTTPEAIGMVETQKRRIDLERLPALAVVLQLDSEKLIELSLNEYYPRMMAAYRSDSKKK